MPRATGDLDLWIRPSAENAERVRRAHYWTAVINGVLAPFLLTGILLVASDPRLMAGQPSSWLARTTVAVTTAAMFGAAIAMFALGAQ